MITTILFLILEVFINQLTTDKNSFYRDCYRFIYISYHNWKRREEEIKIELFTDKIDEYS